LLTGTSRYLALTDWIANQPGNLQHTHTHTDCGYPGISPINDRPRLRQPSPTATQGAFDLLVVYDLARLARSPRVLQALMSDLDAAKVRLCSVTEQLDTRRGAALLMLLRVFADREANPIAKDPPMPTRVATLTRRSTDEQNQPFSIELQDTKLGAYIKSQDD
jgi:DNA invertase Pin-like site-specific DNA recombinase